jgi:D-ribose pyranase
MLKHGIIHAELLGHIGRLRHLDRFCIADAGLPVPKSVPCIDLGIVYGTPSFAAVVAAVCEPLILQRAIVATQMATVNPEVAHSLATLLTPLTLEEIDHNELKVLLTGTAFVVRTGEATPYANVILEAGVPF